MKPIVMFRFSVTRSLATCLLVSMAAACVTETPRGQLQPVKADLPRAARENTELGTEYMRQGLMDKAIDKLKRAIADDSSYAPAHATLAWVYSLRGNSDEADLEFRRAVSADSNDPTTRFYLGSYQCQNHKFDEGQRNLLLAARNLNFSGATLAWTSAGQCAFESHLPDQAESNLREALRIAPDFAPALAEMAVVQFAKGDFAATHLYLDQYERVGPATPALLLIGVRTERSLGHFDAARAYELKLLQKFPDSEETAKLQTR